MFVVVLVPLATNATACPVDLFTPCGLGVVPNRWWCPPYHGLSRLHSESDTRQRTLFGVLSNAFQWAVYGRNDEVACLASWLIHPQVSFVGCQCDPPPCVSDHFVWLPSKILSSFNSCASCGVIIPSALQPLSETNDGPLLCCTGRGNLSRLFQLSTMASPTLRFRISFSRVALSSSSITLLKIYH